MLTDEQARESLVVALDLDRGDALELADKLRGKARWVKVGMTLFYAEGPSIVHEMRERGLKVFLDLKLHGQTVRVPARLAEHLAPLHRLIARQHILDNTRQNVPDMRAAVRRRRAVVERERIAALTLVNGTLCNMIIAPKIRNGFLARGKIQICIYFFVQRNPSRSIHSHAILARERRFFKEQAAPVQDFPCTFM